MTAVALSLKPLPLATGDLDVLPMPTLSAALYAYNWASALVSDSKQSSNFEEAGCRMTKRFIDIRLDAHGAAYLQTTQNGRFSARSC
jgi:hypothetical protein